jgi:NACalpha-BTF3-like transcription factor
MGGRIIRADKLKAGESVWIVRFNGEYVFEKAQVVFVDAQYEAWVTMGSIGSIVMQRYVSFDEYTNTRPLRALFRSEADAKVAVQQILEEKVEEASQALKKFNKSFVDGKRQIHRMHLWPKHFERLETGEKNIEFRLYDKDRGVEVNDAIIFVNTETKKEKYTIVKAKVIGTFPWIKRVLKMPNPAAYILIDELKEIYGQNIVELQSLFVAFVLEI